MQPRTFSILLVLLYAITAAEAHGGQPSDLLYVWAWDKDKQDSDFLAVIDVDEGSPNYGEVVNSVAVGVVGFAHHVEHQMHDPNQLFVNSYEAGRSFVFDLNAPRARPHWISIEPGGNRIVMTGGGTLSGGVVLLRIDEATGTLSLVETFRSANHLFGMSFDRESWPHGDTGPAFAHGAVFRQMADE